MNFNFLTSKTEMFSVKLVSTKIYKNMIIFIIATTAKVSSSFEAY